ncbi:MAG TPA: glycosyltransferase family 2 protein [Rhizomicrobium sp.]|nr:glycosyltransferase family 2 protein [Rhizomicrobium sp.]
MLFSIVINNYNYAGYVREAIESALAQDYSDLEVIVVDDGSTDNSRDVISGFAGKIIPVFKENGGQGSALNAGFAAARGDVILFLDADDTLMPHCCSTIAGLWRPDTVKAHFNLVVIDQDGKNLGNYQNGKVLPSGDVTEQILKSGDYPSMPMSGNAFHRRYLEQVMPMAPEKWRQGADVYLYIQAPFYGAVISSDQPLGYYRMHGGNMSIHVKNNHISIPSIDNFISRERETDAVIRRQAIRLGRSYGNALTRGTAHLQLAFFIVRFRQTLPDATAKDSPISSLARFMAALLGDRALSPLKKLLIGTWMGAIMCLPSRLAENLFVAGYRRGAVLAISRFVATSM